jgi:hypothetical protein
LLAACVLLLGLAAHAPALHAEICTELHGHDHADHADNASAHDHAEPAPAPVADHVCAITLFAAGCEAAPPPVVLPEPVLNAIRVAHFTEFMLARTLRGPARVCGPPVLA